MDDCFNFESMYTDPTRRNLKMLVFSTSDNTDWTLTMEWRVSQCKPEIALQRLIFVNENHYDRHYSIGIDVMSVYNRASGKLEVSATTRQVMTKIVIPLDQYQVFRFSTGGMMKLYGVKISSRFREETFRFRVTLRRIQEAAPCLFEPAPFSSEPATRSSEPEVCLSASVSATGDRLLVHSQQILSLLETSVSSDVLLVAGQTQVRAHRSVLSARSPFFRAMFRYATRESEEGVVRLPEAESGILLEMLRYVYSGVLRPVDADTAEGLFIAADKYGIQALKKACSLVLRTHACPGNFEPLEELYRLIPGDELGDIEDLCFN